VQKIPTLVGVSGHFVGVAFALEYGRTIVVGRSRDADLCLRRSHKYREMKPEEREKDDAAKTVSGKHFEVTMYNLNSIEIKNLSSNGTHVDGKLIQTLRVDDIAKNSHEIRFGVDEVLRLEMHVHEDR